MGQFGAGRHGGNMNVGADNKRKLPTEPDQDVGVRASKVFKDAGEFFDQVSTNNIELAEAEEEVVIEKEIIRNKSKNIKQESEEQTSPELGLSETNKVSSSEEVDDSLINNLLISDDEISDDDCADDSLDSAKRTMTEKISSFLKSQAVNPIETLKQKLIEMICSKNNLIESLKTENSRLRADYEARLKVKKEVLEEDLEKNKSDFDKQVSNIDEEREYLIEEMKVKDLEIEKKASELKQRNDMIREITEKNQTLEKVKSELKRALNERDKRLQRSQEHVTRLESKLKIISKKKVPKTEIESRMFEVEKELDKTREINIKLEDEIFKIENQKGLLKSELDERQKQMSATASQKKDLEKEILDLRAKYVKELRESEQNMKHSENMKNLKIKDLEEIIIKKDQEILEEKNSNTDSQKKICSLEETEKVNEEYKLDLESKIKEMAEIEAKLKNQISSMKSNFSEENGRKVLQLKEEHKQQMEEMKEANQKRIAELENESNAIIMEDLKLMEKNRKEIEDLKLKSESLQSEIESLLNEKTVLQSSVASKAQEFISLQILSSEKEEMLEIQRRNSQKLRAKYEKLKEKMIGLIELKEGLDNRVTVTELKYFTLQKDLSLKQTELSEMQEKLNSKEAETADLKKNIEEIENNHGEELEKANKARLDVENLLESEKEKISLEKVEIKKTKDFLLQQIEQIKKKSGDKILLAMETIEIS